MIFFFFFFKILATRARLNHLAWKTKKRKDRPAAAHFSSSSNLSLCNSNGALSIKNMKGDRELQWGIMNGYAEGFFKFAQSEQARRQGFCARILVEHESSVFNLEIN